MKIITSRLTKLFNPSIALFLLTVPAFCQSGPPAFPAVQLNQWVLAQPNWPDIYGDASLRSANLNTAPGWSHAGTALSVDTNVPAFLNLSVMDDGEANISLPAGAFSFWFQPNYTSATDGGDGPTNWASLLTIGQWTSNASASCWSLVVDPDGTNLIFLAQSNGASQIVLTAPINFDAGDWHNIVLNYSETNCCLFLEGQPVTNAGAAAYLPSDGDCAAYGFSIGSEGGTNGIFQARGQFQDLRTYDGPLAADDVAQDYADASTAILNHGGSLPSSSGFHSADDGVPQIPGDPGTNSGGGIGSDGVTNLLQTYVITTNYQNYTNFWLSVTNSPASALVSVMSTLPALTYEILTNSNLASTNWGVWKTLTASSSVTPAPPLALGSNSLFFKGALVWSSCSNSTPPLPDWWAMLYFNSLCPDPSGNPSGDGINNLNKYLMGLNPNIAYVSPLIVLPPSGDYVSTPAITIFSLDSETIKDTTDGSTPSAINGMSSSSGVPLTNLPTGNFTLKAWESGLTPNVVTSNTYTIIAAAPTFSLPSGVYSNGTTVQISCATTTATVRYTTNGIDPTTSSTQILPANVITLTTNVTFKAAAWLNGVASPVATASYIVQYAPTNDNFANATTLTGPSGQVQGSLVGSTLEYFRKDQSKHLFRLGGWLGLVQMDGSLQWNRRL